jgi:hypothetical protein
MSPTKRNTPQEPKISALVRELIAYLKGRKIDRIKAMNALSVAHTNLAFTDSWPKSFL